MQMLDQNFEYIKVIADCQKRGMTSDANAYSAKLHQNLQALARQAERQPPSDINQVCNTSHDVPS
jgi:SSXT protein (N-terminal region)